jgi:hypothetical protein
MMMTVAVGAMEEVAEAATTTTAAVDRAGAAAGVKTRILIAASP